eukprot:CCRYP_012703-RA/>CCRYP_012703-RA protein AED:0.46 eAED:0.39 QI:0/-1/0/1/-1/1/1/0/156
MDAFTKLQSSLTPAATPQPHSPRLNFHNNIQVHTVNPDGVIPPPQSPSPHLIVESPLATVTPPPSSSEHSPLHTNPTRPDTTNAFPPTDNESIATRVAQRQRTPRDPPNDSIAARLLARCCNSAHTVVDMETGQALESPTPPPPQIQRCLEHLRGQ